MKINLLDTPVLYINLDKDTDKNYTTKSILDDLGFKNVIRIPGTVVYDPKVVYEGKTLGAINGCKKAHLDATTKMQVPFLVIEDDVSMLYFQEEIDVPDDADAIYLGVSAFGIEAGDIVRKIRYQNVEGYPHLKKVYNMLSAHAILFINQNYIDACNTLISQNKDRSQDNIKALLQPLYNIYAFSKPMFHQNGENSKHTKITLV